MKRLLVTAALALSVLPACAEEPQPVNPVRGDIVRIDDEMLRLRAANGTFEFEIADRVSPWSTCASTSGAVCRFSSRGTRAVPGASRP